MDFSVIRRSGMTQAEFAALCGVSRVTANTWVRGKMRPHRYTKAKIVLLLDHLESAIKAGDLPLLNGSANRDTQLRMAVRRAALRAKKEAAKA
jgi:transcriptional regulator with XRE-family HTH domain